MEENCLNENQYEQVKLANKGMVILLNKYVKAMYGLFKDIYKYIKNPCKLEEIIEQKVFKYTYHYQTILYILELCKKKKVVKDNGETEILRCYDSDVYKKMDDLYWDYFMLMFENYRGVSECFEISECLKKAGMQEMEEVSKIFSLELDKLRQQIEENMNR